MTPNTAAKYPPGHPEEGRHDVIIWGWRTRWSRTKESGTFECPDCGAERQWVKAVLRMWFTFFFIPLFPTGKARAEAVQCTTCKARFEPAVLTRVTANQLRGAFSTGLRLGVVAVLRSGGAERERARQAAVLTLKSVFDGYDLGALHQDVTGLDLGPLTENLRMVGQHALDRTREQLLYSVSTVAVVGGCVDAARPTLDRIGELLELTPAHRSGVLAQVAEEATKPGTTSREADG